ncbi:hypothetical protein [uncultured Tateyamaria sp.]|uniref:helix-turn-helix transcriptional regulator n=1 Tax=uncultured Tateyamaria sp. TaxID=455651 RepID=UPI0026385963|nr:hypothetical protein [uncultured Tateyamaria sp.]
MTDQLRAPQIRFETIEVHALPALAQAEARLHDALRHRLNDKMAVHTMDASAQRLTHTRFLNLPGQKAERTNKNEALDYIADAEVRLRDDRPARVMCSPAAKWLSVDHLYSRQDRAQSFILNEFLRPHMGSDEFMVFRSELPGGRLLANYVCMSLRDLTPAVHAQIDNYRRVSESVTLREAFGLTPGVVNGWQDDSVYLNENVGVVAFDDCGAVTEMNATASAIVADTQTLVIRSGQLCARDPISDRHLQAVLALLHRDEGIATPKSVILRDAFGRERVRVALVQLTFETDDLRPQRMPVLLLRDLADVGTADVDALSRMFGLTGAEVRLAGLLAGGLTIPEIMLRTGLSASTLRAHQRALGEKLSVQAQADLPRLLRAFSR